MFKKLYILLFSKSIKIIPPNTYIRFSKISLDLTVVIGDSAFFIQVDTGAAVLKCT